jgi:hypothetical protein
LGRPLLAIGVAPRADGRPVGDAHSQCSLDALSAGHEIEFKLDFVIGIEDEAARLRAAAEARPMRLPVNRKVDESHHAVMSDGLSVWYTIQVSPHSRIQEAIVGAQAAEAPGLPGAMTRRFEAFERNPELEAPIA